MKVIELATLSGMEFDRKALWSVTSWIRQRSGRHLHSLFGYTYKSYIWKLKPTSRTHKCRRYVITCPCCIDSPYITWLLLNVENFPIQGCKNCNLSSVLNEDHKLSCEREAFYACRIDGVGNGYRYVLSYLKIINFQLRRQVQFKNLVQIWLMLNV